MVNNSCHKYQIEVTLQCGDKHQHLGRVEIVECLSRTYSLTRQVLWDRPSVGTVRLDVLVKDNKSPVVLEEHSDSDPWCLVDGATMKEPAVNPVPGVPGAPSAMLSGLSPTERDVEAAAQPSTLEKMPAVVLSEAQVPAMCQSVDPVPLMHTEPDLGVVPVEPGVPADERGREAPLHTSPMICAALVAQRAQRLEAIFSTLTGPSISINAVKRGAFQAPEPVSENLCYLKVSGASKEP